MLVPMMIVVVALCRCFIRPLSILLLRLLLRLLSIATLLLWYYDVLYRYCYRYRCTTFCLLTFPSARRSKSDYCASYSY